MRKVEPLNPETTIQRELLLVNALKLQDGKLLAPG